MISLRTGSVVLFLCLAISSQCRARDLATSLTDVLLFCNGDFDNSDELVGDGFQDTDRLIFKPVSIPGLQKDPVLFLEQALNGKIYRRFLALRNTNSTDRILHMTYYNFTTRGDYEPGTFNFDDLANLTREDLSGFCQANFQKVTPKLLVADFYDCRHTIQGRHPTYGNTITCNDIIYESPLAAEEPSTLSPYHLKLRGKKFPLIGAPEGYVNPCKGGL